MENIPFHLPPTQITAKCRRNCDKQEKEVNQAASNLSVSVQYVAIESVSVGESLRAGAFSDTDNSMLLRMQDTPLHETTALPIPPKQDKVSKTK